MTKEIIIDEKKEKEMKKEQTQAEVQQKIMTYQILQRHLENIRKEAELVERKFIETEATRQLLGDIKMGSKETEMLLPVGNGLFAKGKLTDKKLLMEIGAGILTKKSIESAEQVVNETRVEIEQAAKKLNNEMKEAVQKLNQLTPELQKMVKR